jgi:hypothetical protein
LTWGFAAKAGGVEVVDVEAQQPGPQLGVFVREGVKRGGVEGEVADNGARQRWGRGQPGKATSVTEHITS